MPEVKVKDIVEYLQSLNQESTVALDQEGWDGGNTPKEVIVNSGLFSVGSDYVIIKN